MLAKPRSTRRRPPGPREGRAHPRPTSPTSSPSWASGTACSRWSPPTTRVWSAPAAGRGDRRPWSRGAPPPVPGPPPVRARSHVAVPSPGWDRPGGRRASPSEPRGREPMPRAHRRTALLTAAVVAVPLLLTGPATAAPPQREIEDGADELLVI